MDWKGQLQLIKRGVVDVIPEQQLIEKLKMGRPLRVKYGIDPTSPDVHLGHTVPIRKLRQFQQLGHKAVVIIGDATAQVGDPSGRDETRPRLTPEQAEANAKDYIDQIAGILDISLAEVVRNSQWFSEMSFFDTIRLASKLTVNRALERDAFEERFKSANPIFLHELIYCLMQGYDSVMVKADVELGATEQTYNLLVGRDLQRDAGQQPQVCLTLPILLGTDGVQKMGKTLSNYIGVNEPPNEMFGKLMSISDQIMPNYFQLLTDIPEDEIQNLLAEGNNPRDAKLRLAEAIVTDYHGRSQAQRAREEFIRVFSHGQIPQDMPEVTLAPGDLKDGTIWIVKLVTLCGLAPSNSEARRLITQGAVKIGAAQIQDPEQEVQLKSGAILQVGKRRFAKLKLPS